jgi:hypothetical protein
MDPELIPLREVRERLGVSKVKMAQLVRDGLFPVYENPLDGREKLARWADVEAALGRPRPIRRNQDATEGKAAA